MASNYWLSERQWTAIEPLLSLVHTGPRRTDDKRVVSGILHQLQTGCPWRKLPREYGPYSTAFNRYNRWRRNGLWARLLEGLRDCPDAPGFLSRETAKSD